MTDNNAESIDSEFCHLFCHLLFLGKKKGLQSLVNPCYIWLLDQDSNLGPID